MTHVHYLHLRVKAQVNSKRSDVNGTEPQAVRSPCVISMLYTIYKIYPIHTTFQCTNPCGLCQSHRYPDYIFPKSTPALNFDAAVAFPF